MNGLKLWGTPAGGGLVGTSRGWLNCGGSPAGGRGRAGAKGWRRERA